MPTPWFRIWLITCTFRAENATNSDKPREINWPLSIFVEIHDRWQIGFLTVVHMLTIISGHQLKYSRPYKTSNNEADSPIIRAFAICESRRVTLAAAIYFLIMPGLALGNNAWRLLDTCGPKFVTCRAVDAVPWNQLEVMRSRALSEKFQVQRTATVRSGWPRNGSHNDVWN